MNDLIKVNYSNNDVTVSGRDLHEFLEVGTEYAKWFSRMVEYGFIENHDYTEVIVKNDENSKGGRPSIDHAIKLNMAKEICMIQRTEKGKQARQYFISLETAWNTPEMVISRALKMAENKIQELSTINLELLTDNKIMKPKADYFDDLVDRNLLTNFRDTAKELKVKEKVFIKYLMDNKYIYRDKKNQLRPYADKNKDLFEVKEYSSNNWSGVQTLITPKGRETFRLLIKDYLIKV